jgi:hypothetical protein
MEEDGQPHGTGAHGGQHWPSVLFLFDCLGTLDAVSEYVPSAKGYHSPPLVCLESCVGQK